MPNNEDRGGWELPSISPYSNGLLMPSRGFTTASATYPTANKAIFAPMRVNVPTLVTKLAAYVGATSSGNIDVGIYAADGTRLVSSGSTAQSATVNAWQLFDVTDTLLLPGIVYYLAVAMDNTTGTLFRAGPGAAIYLKTKGLAEMTTAFPLPATATLATIASAYYPMIGAVVGAGVI